MSSPDKATIYFAEPAEGVKPAKEFWEKLDEPVRSKFEAIFKTLRRDGWIGGEDKLKKLEGDIWEFKVRGKKHYRLFAGKRPEGKWYLTHGWEKKSNKTPRREIERAKRIMRQVDKRLAKQDLRQSKGKGTGT